MSPAFPREAKPPKPVLSVRSQINKDLHPSVDTALRDLKKFSRRLHSTFDAFCEELQVLDRVFYKGKNQHRSALFWRRVADIRKFSQRIAEYNAPRNVDSCRCSFFGPDVQATSKALKGAWSHLPDDRTMAYLLDRLAAGINLLDKAHERLLNAYRAFILEMQSGFFLQLILTLAALASRLDVLVQDLADALRGSWASMYKLFRALNPSEAKKIQKPQAAVALDSDTQELPAHASPSTLPVVEEMMGGVEDTGETIKRVEAKVPIEPSIVGSANSAPPFDPTKANRSDEAKPAFTMVDDNEDTITVADITVMPAPAQIITVPPTAPPIKATPATAHPPKQLSVAAQSTRHPKKRPVEDAKAKEPAPKKKKKKKDAIDDIFGF